MSKYNDCKVSRFDQCRLIQKSYESAVFDFGDTDISNDTFEYRVKKYLSSKTEIYPVEIINEHQVVISEFHLPKGVYEHELIWINENGTAVVFQGKLTITDKGSDCGCGSKNQPIVVDNGSTVVDVDIVFQGEKGNPGESAYEIAVENGFVGTEEEWLESLKGEKGDTGEQGQQGIQGEKGDKGDAFTYDDFTPEQIAELQQPAIDAGDEAKQEVSGYIAEKNIEINQVIDDAETATTNANQSASNADNSAELADIATQNAETATQNANNATASANQAANNANTATQNAVTATNDAITATQNANEAVQTVDDKLNEIDGILGEKADHGYSSGETIKTLKEVEEESDNLIFEYVHNSNLEVIIESIDYSTGTFTTIGNHNLPSTGRRSITPFLIEQSTTDPDVLKFLPNNLVFGQRNLYIHFATLTENTFQLTSDSFGGGVPINNFSEKNTTDFSKFKFELINSIPNIVGFPNDINSLYITISGKISSISYLYPIVEGLNFTSTNNYGMTNNGQNDASVRFVQNKNYGNLSTFVNINVNATNGVLQEVVVYSVNSLATSPFVVATRDYHFNSTRIYERNKYNITGYTLNSANVANGTTIKIYKL